MPSSSGPHLLSTAIAGGLVAGAIAARFFPASGSLDEADASARGVEVISAVRPAQLPAPHVASELSALVSRGVTALRTGVPLREVLEYRSDLGARLYAFFRASPRGRRVRFEGGHGSDGEVPRPSPSPSLHERLTPDELATWETVVHAGGGWCAYISASDTEALRTEYVRIERPRVPGLPDIYLSTGFSV